MNHPFKTPYIYLQVMKSDLRRNPITYLYLSCLCLARLAGNRRVGAVVASKPQAVDGLIPSGVYAI